MNRTKQFIAFLICAVILFKGLNLFTAPVKAASTPIAEIGYHIEYHTQSNISSCNNYEICSHDSITEGETLATWTDGCAKCRSYMINKSTVAMYSYCSFDNQNVFVGTMEKDECPNCGIYYSYCPNCNSIERIDGGAISWLCPVCGTAYQYGTAICTYTHSRCLGHLVANTNTKYVVNHYLMNASENDYILKESENCQGTTASSLVISDLRKSYEGYQYKGGKGTTKSDSTIPTTFDTTTDILANGTRVINLFYIKSEYSVTYKDVVDSTSGIVLKETTASKKYGSSVRGTDIGSSTADNAYYNGYYYVSDTSATVGTSGATVYRIFKLRTINISGAVSWTDNSNKWSTRPNEVTVSLYRDGLKVDSTTGLTSSNNNNYSFNNIPKYSTSDGHVYNYTVSQSEAVSKTSPEDKYTTTQNTYNFTNVLGNTDKDADNKGLVVKGSIYWEDKGDALGYRPKTVTITLYQNGKEYKTLEVDAFNDNTYEFSKLPKYDKDLNKYEYTVKETMVANYLVTENGQPVLKDAYSIKADTPNALDFTNVFNVPDSTPIPVKPEHGNTVTVKTNTEDMITISLKGMETIINSDLSVSYGNNYNGQVYNLSANNIGTVLSSINSGKYEISYLDATYILNDITCDGDNNIWIEGSGDKYYLVIKDTNTDVLGAITLHFSKKDHIGYQTDASVSNYFKVGIETTAIMSLEAEVFAISDMIIEAEDAYSIIYNDSDTIDENIYNAGDEAEVLDYEGKLPKNKEFLGWSLLEDAEEPDYLVGDIISIKDMNISLYPVFKDIEEEISEMESTEETTESSESIEESSETEESTMEETSSEEETTESEEISTENNSSEEAASTEEESSESSETIENSKLEK